MGFLLLMLFLWVVKEVVGDGFDKVVEIFDNWDVLVFGVVVFSVRFV